MSKRRQPYRKGDEIEYRYGFPKSVYTGIIESNSMKYKECFVRIAGGGLHYITHKEISFNYSTANESITEPSEDIYNDLI